MLDISAQAGGLYVGEFGQPNQLADVYGIKASDLRWNRGNVALWRAPSLYRTL